MGIIQWFCVRKIVSFNVKTQKVELFPIRIIWNFDLEFYVVSLIGTLDCLSWVHCMNLHLMLEYHFFFCFLICNYITNAQSSSEVQEFSFSKWLGFWLFLFLLKMIAFASELLAVKSLFEHGPACGPPQEYGGFCDGWMGYMEHVRPKRGKTRKDNWAVTGKSCSLTNCPKGGVIHHDAMQILITFVSFSCQMTNKEPISTFFYWIT